MTSQYKEYKTIIAANRERAIICYQVMNALVSKRKLRNITQNILENFHPSERDLIKAGAGVSKAMHSTFIGIFFSHLHFAGLMDKLNAYNEALRGVRNAAKLHQSTHLGDIGVLMRDFSLFRLQFCSGVI